MRRSYRGTSLLRVYGKSIKMVYVCHPKKPCEGCGEQCHWRSRSWGPDYLCKTCAPIVKRNGLNPRMLPALTTKRILDAMKSETNYEDL